MQARKPGIIIRLGRDHRLDSRWSLLFYMTR